MNDQNNPIGSKDNPYTVTSYNANLKSYIQKLNPCFITGEIIKKSNYGNSSYVTIKDLTDDSIMECSTFQSGTSLKIKEMSEGAEIVMYSKPDFWNKKGKLTMSILDIEEVGAANFLKDIELLKKKLAAEGIFDSDHKLPLPAFPSKIGLICGKNAKAKDDVIENVMRQWPFVEFEIKEVSVGNSPNTPREVISALNEFESAAQKPDIVIITRGGGALEEVVFPFSNEELVRFVYAYSIPTIGAIGHETDCPLLDFVVDYRASTPTDAAKTAVPSAKNESEIISQLLSSLQINLQNKIDSESHKINRYTQSTVLKNITDIFTPHLLLIKSNRDKIASIINYKLQNESVISKKLSEKIETVMNYKLQTATAETRKFSEKLEILNPNNTLDRGYSLTYINGKLIKSVQSVKTGDDLLVNLKDGQIQSTITKINN
ncbi:MAG: exodeoxyribonuclease VII large subunit [Bifidobacteriaceae bacterium]|jgi:exodeoxyribonuclease VII large subunit|nr:exodeoxyribonuclease VII large subunit [Bifidobacteriaceae bacterium]